MRSIKLVSRLGILPLLFVLTACAGTAPPKAANDKPVEYAVPVAVGCVDEAGRPARPQPLNQRYTAEAWAALPVGSKAQAVAAQGGKRMNHADALEAATSGCR